MSNDSIDYPEARLIRSEALKWWALQTDEHKRIYVGSVLGAERLDTALTGREIEKIYVSLKD